MVITITKLRMAHASTHGARKPPGPMVVGAALGKIVYIINLFKFDINLLLHNFNVFILCGSIWHKFKSIPGAYLKNTQVYF